MLSRFGEDLKVRLCWGFLVSGWFGGLTLLQGRGKREEGVEDGERSWLHAKWRPPGVRARLILGSSDSRCRLVDWAAAQVCR